MTLNADGVAGSTRLADATRAVATDDAPRGGRGEAGARTLGSSALARIVEALYAEDRELASWASELARTVDRAFPRSRGVGVAVVEDGVLLAGASTAGEMLTRALHVDPGGERPTGDEIRLVGHVEWGVVAIVAIAIDPTSAPSPHELALLVRAELHLENALRLRRWRDPLTPLIRTGAEVARPASSAGAGADLWNALTTGHATLARVGDGVYAILEGSEPSHHRRVSGLEARVVVLAAQGMPIKALSSELGVTPSTVSRHLWNAAAKIGLPSVFDLVRVASRLAVAPRVVPTDRLTRAERDVLMLVREGMSNDEIARARGRSKRTVASQVASVLRKTRSASRRALVTGVVADDEQERPGDQPPAPESEEG